MTKLELETRIKREVDLEEETFVTQDEFDDYLNEAYLEAVRVIQNLYQDYYFTENNLTLAIDGEYITMPSDIFATKIRGIFYYDGSESYEIVPIKRQGELIDTDSECRYKYKIISDATNGARIKLIPASREASTTNVTIHYIRGVNEMTADTDETDLPETNGAAIRYIMEDVKYRVLKKDGDPRYQDALQSKAIYQMQLEETLTDATPDDNSDIYIDRSFYEELV